MGKYAPICRLQPIKPLRSNGDHLVQVASGLGLLCSEVHSVPSDLTGEKVAFSPPPERSRQG
jgi:hypothetical protein